MTESQQVPADPGLESGKSEAEIAADAARERALSVARDYPRHWVADVLASDGGVVHLRPIVPEDADRIVEFHSKLSERTRYLRYFGPYPTISKKDLFRFTVVDHHTRVAFVALLGDEIIAVGRYEGLPDEGDGLSAEVAFTVADAHQGRGLGPILLEHLAGAAAENGLHTFVAEVLAENRHMITVFREAGYQVSRSFEGGVVRLEFAIDPTEALVSVRNAEFLANEVPGVSVPDVILQRMRAASAGGKEAALAEGVRISREMLEAVAERRIGRGDGGSVLAPFSTARATLVAVSG